jgi:hypothetical protein
MPAASVYFRDPDGQLLELLAMLPDAPNHKLGILGWASWQHQIDCAAELVQGSSPAGGLP